MLQLIWLTIAIASANSGTLKLELNGVKESRGGSILCALFRSDAGFPMQPERALEIQQAVKSEKWECTFQNLRAARYAVSVIHDQNGDGKMETNKFGIPLEGWATSNNIVPAMRPPTFDESSFNFDGHNKVPALKMHY